MNSSILSNYPVILYALGLTMIWLSIVLVRKKRTDSIIQRQQQARELGLTEPASLHPVIDPNICLGCGACTRACPEGDILGLIGGKAQLIEPANCIGHGACQSACPLDAISLVFGTETRGVDIPVLKANFETDVDGIFIAGELGGMGLIKNAVEQGVQAANEVAIMLKNIQKKHDSQLDLVIVGAGPAGIAASLKAKQEKLNFITIDQDTLGGTVAHFPRNKIVMTAPVNLPLVGKVKFRETTKEALLELWQNVIEKTQLQIAFGKRLEDVEKNQNGFLLKTNDGDYQTRAVLLCLGRRGTPRKLGVDGEQLSKVVYRLVDPQQYQGQHVLVVGGGDSALEAATSIAEQEGTVVTLSYRGESFNRAKSKNRDKVQSAQQAGKLTVMLQSQVRQIGLQQVTIDYQQQQHTIANEAVIICAGGILPTPFLAKIGINIETKHGTA